MKIRILFCTAAGAICLSAVALGQGEDAFTKANQEYAAGHFREAIDLYQNLARAGETSAALFYNLGNAHFRAEDLGRAILNYERSLALQPHHPEAEANLRLVRDKARALELRRNALERVTTQITATQLSVAAAGAFWIALFLLAILIFARRRSPLFTGVFVLSLVVLGLSVYGLYLLETGPAGGNLAIVTAKSTDARLAVADNSGTVLTLPPGSEIKVLSERGDWIYAELPNNLRGWLPAQNAERVRL